MIAENDSIYQVASVCKKGRNFVCLLKNEVTGELKTERIANVVDGGFFHVRLEGHRNPKYNFYAPRKLARKLNDDYGKALAYNGEEGEEA